MQTAKDRIHLCYIQVNLKYREENCMFTQRNLKTNRKDVQHTVSVLLAGGTVV